MIKELNGKIIIQIQNNENELIFHCEDGTKYKMYHSQDCCEEVFIDDINGDLDDLIGVPIIMSEEISNDEFEKEYSKSEEAKIINRYGSYTWTFYKFATVKGYVNIRWFGQSNGYYSESVDFVKADVNGNFNRY